MINKTEGFEGLRRLILSSYFQQLEWAAWLASVSTSIVFTYSFAVTKVDHNLSIKTTCGWPPIKPNYELAREIPRFCFVLLSV